MPDLDHLSYSSISTYQMCPRSWKFRYVDKVPVKTSTALVFGSAFHDAIEDYLRQRTIDTLVTDGVVAPEKPLTACWGQAWSTQVERNGADNIEWGEETPEALSNQGLAMLSDEEVIQTLNGLAPLVDGDHIHIEDYVTLSVPGVPIPVIGYIDIITEDGVPGDFKTSSRRWSSSRGDDEMQPVFYLAALNQAGYVLNPERRFRHYVFVKTKTPQMQVVQSTRTAGELLWLLDMVRSVWEGIAAEVYPMNPGTWKCSPKWCEYWSLCRGRYG